MSNTPAIVNRPVRTAAHGALALTIIEFIDAVVYDLNDRAYGASVALLAVVLSWLQVAIENYRNKGLLRDVYNND